MRNTIAIILTAFALKAHAQLDTICTWRFGISGLVSFSNVVTNANTNAGVGAGIAAFAHFEPNECTNYFVALSYSSNPFAYTEKANKPKNLIERSYLSLYAERGISLVRYVRFQYGFHARVLTGVSQQFNLWANMTPLDAGFNFGLFYYSTPQISLGLRYMQGLVPVVSGNNSDVQIRGLNSQLLASVSIRVF